MSGTIQEARTAYRKALDARKAALLAEVTAVDREIAVLNSLAGIPPADGQRPVRLLLEPRTRPSENPSNDQLLPLLREFFAPAPFKIRSAAEIHAFLVERGCAFKGRDPAHALRHRMAKMPDAPFWIDRTGICVSGTGPLAPPDITTSDPPDGSAAPVAPVDLDAAEAGPHQGEDFPRGGV